jgi:hypothetical protein
MGSGIVSKLGRRVASNRPLRVARENGAAAVEFALVSGILFLVLFGILQYGLYFNDSLNTRQGVREGARQGVVRNFPSCGTATTDLDRLKCNTEHEIGALTGPTYVKVVTPAGGWAKAKPLTVCAMVKSDGALGLLPMPNDGWILSKTQMSIEQAATPLPTGTASADTLPSGATWSWWS